MLVLVLLRLKWSDPLRLPDSGRARNTGESKKQERLQWMQRCVSDEAKEGVLGYGSSPAVYGRGRCRAAPNTIVSRRDLGQMDGVNQPR